MSLHILYHSENFEEAILKAINQGGDSDTIGAVTGMFAGAFYGVDNIILQYYKEGAKWDNFETAIKAYKLYKLSN